MTAKITSSFIPANDDDLQEELRNASFDDYWTTNAKSKYAKTDFIDEIKTQYDKALEAWRAGDLLNSRNKLALDQMEAEGDVLGTAYQSSLAHVDMERLRKVKMRAALRLKKHRDKAKRLRAEREEVDAADKAAAILEKKANTMARAREKAEKRKLAAEKRKEAAKNRKKPASRKRR